MEDEKIAAKVLLMVNRDFVLYNFRLELIEALLQKNYQVYICLPYGEKVDKMIDMGCHFVPVEIDRRGKNPLRETNNWQSVRMFYVVGRKENVNSKCCPVSYIKTTY